MENHILPEIKSIKPVQQSLPEQVAEQINQLIIDRHLGTGEKIPNEFELAQQLNVGRSTVREAIKLLVSRNVLEIKRGRGTFVADNTGMIDDPFGFAYMEDEARLVRELFVIRYQMEPWIASLAAQNATAEDIAALREQQKKVDDLIDAKADHLPEDQKLHVAIAQCTHNSILPLLVPVITYSIHLFGKMNHHSLREESKRTHAKIIDAIEAHNASAAEEAMKEHLQVNKRSLTELEQLDVE